MCPHCGNTVVGPQKHCIHCGGLLGDAGTACDEEHACPFRVEIKDKFYTAGQTGVIEFAYESRPAFSDRQRVEIGLECSGFREMLKDKPIIDKGSKAVRFEFVPVVDGELVIKLHAIHWDEGGEVNVYEAEDTIWVNGAPQHDADNNINISLGDLNGNYGVDMSGAINVTIDNSRKREAGPPEAFRENQYRPLGLYWSFESTKLMQGAPQQGAWFVKRAKAGQKNIVRAWLRAVMPDGECRIACIRTGDSLTLGRDSSCDVVCHLLTSDNTFDPRCNSVSGRHCRLTVKKQTCYLYDDSSNGTFINQNLCHHAREAVGDGDVLNPAGVMPLRLREFRDFSKLQDEIRGKMFHNNMSKLSFAKSSFVTEEIPRLPINCLRLRRVVAGRNEFENFVLLKELDVGSGATNALVLEHPSVARLHGKIVLGNECLYWVNYSAAQPTSVSGVELDTHESFPLKSGDRIRLGEVVLEFDAESK